MSELIFEIKIGENWREIPASLIGSDSSGITFSIMKNFVGMVLEQNGTGNFNLPPHDFLLPSGDMVNYGINWVAETEVSDALRICIGLIMLNTIPINMDSDYRITSKIEFEGNIYGSFKSSFTIKNGLVENFICLNEFMDSPIKILSHQFTGDVKCVPVIFALENTNEFSESFTIEEIYHQIPGQNKIPAYWVKPIEYIDMYPVNLNFNIDSDAINEFNIPKTLINYTGKRINLPSYDSLIKRNFIPKNWQIENAEYPLGGVYRLTDHDVTANLIYEAKNFTGLVDM